MLFCLQIPQVEIFLVLMKIALSLFLLEHPEKVPKPRVIKRFLPNLEFACLNVHFPFPCALTSHIAQSFPWITADSIAAVPAGTVVPIKTADLNAMRIHVVVQESAAKIPRS